jgi:transcriptional regulator with XRE-family HTH domain
MPKLYGLRAVRERRALSQQDLAEATGMAQATLSRLERLEQACQPRTLRKLATALKVSPEELIGVAEGVH